MRRHTVQGLAPQRNRPARPRLDTLGRDRPSGYYSESAPKAAELAYKAAKSQKPPSR